LIAQGIGCSRHIKPEKFELDHNIIRKFQGNVPIKVIVPENAEREYLIESTKSKSGPSKLYVDLNVLYKNAKELIEGELNRHLVPLSEDADRFIKFKIEGIKWEIWAMGFSIGAYLEFEVETSNGYKHLYKVQDGSTTDVSRAVGGTISRAVEKMFEDNSIISFIEHPETKTSKFDS
jgi:hypothetical protein